MPNIKSVKKDVLRSRIRNLRNRAAKSTMRTFVKKANTAIATGNVEEITPAIAKIISVLDKTAKRGIIHKNAAARRKSRLMRRANAVTAAATA
ncbi:MAG: 30S ribosomal protein S20 [Akkermansiaceae bacterium]|nr:30S ribosomal protein S20 [Armatimonadota bacterium]